MQSTPKVAISWQVIAVSLATGLTFGLHIGYCGIAIEFIEDFSKCSRYSNPASCNASELCEWYSSNASDYSSCVHQDLVLPASPRGPATCDCTSNATVLQNDHCHLIENSEKCHNPYLSSAQIGMFSGIFVCGGMLGSLVAARIILSLGQRRTVALSGCICFVSGVMLVGGWMFNAGGIVNYPLLVVGRIVAGFGSGIGCVVTPMFAHDMSPGEFAPKLGCAFQIAITGGIFIISAVGYLVHNFGQLYTDPNSRHLLQVCNALPLATSAVMIVLGFVISEPEGDTWDERRGSSFHVSNRGDSRDTVATSNEPLVSRNAEAVQAQRSFCSTIHGIPWWKLRVQVASAILLAAVQQLTGINAIMNYTPRIASNLGLPAFEGNMVVMAWNFVTSAVSPFLTHRFRAGPVYMTSAVVASLACIATAFPVHPGCHLDGDTADGLTAAGIAVFIAAFEIGMGPCFYMLAQAVFPASYRAEGCSFTLVVQFIFNIIINWGYPVAKEAASGGSDKDQRKGVAIMLWSFGAVGLVCTALFRWNTRHPQQSPNAYFQ